MITCPNCGKENEEGSKFCISCGADLSSKEAIRRERKQIELPGRIPFEAFVTMIAVYTVLCAIGYTLLSVGLMFGGGIAGMIEDFSRSFSYSYYGGESSGKLFLLALVSIVCFIIAIWGWSATIGLFRKEKWANRFTRWFQIPNVISAVAGCVLTFSPITVLSAVFTIAVAFGIWRYLK